MKNLIIAAIFSAGISSAQEETVTVTDCTTDGCGDPTMCCGIGYWPVNPDLEETFEAHEYGYTCNYRDTIIM